MKPYLFAAAIALAVSPPVSSGVLNGDLDQLSNSYVPIAGTMERVRCYMSSDEADCERRYGLMVRFSSIEGDVCVLPSTVVCTTSCSGLVAMDSDKDLYVFVQSSIGSNFRRYPVRHIDCPVGI
jgi:hypothetical protein